MSTADMRSQGALLDSVFFRLPDIVGKEEGMTSERSRMSRPRRQGRWKIQSQRLFAEGVDGFPVCESMERESGARVIWLFASVTVEAGFVVEEGLSCVSLRPVKVDTKTEEPVGLYVVLRRR